MASVQQIEKFYDAIEAIKPTGALVGAHCENGDLIDALVANKRKCGELGVSNHPLTRPAMIESEAIKRFSTIGAALEYPVHIVHVSSKEAQMKFYVSGHQDIK